MTSGTKRAWKLQEFVAHGSNVNCLALGHKSGRVMVTGGEDKKVNMWAVGKPNCIMSLSGHTSPVESVRFMYSEEMVVAGSMSGALKIWDLEAAKIVRTLTGHKSSIRSLDFHPYGDFVGSGSLDTNIKLWDIRRKGCIFTYKGHTNCINCLRFSPDGRWIASAGEDGLVKLWDLTAGKLLADLKQHTGPVNNIEFHPNEFLMASASSDRTVKFWDLETFHMVSTTDGDCGPIRCISFHPEGLCLYAGVQDVLKVYGWEPAQCYDSLMLGWGKPLDIAIAQNQLIGANFSQMNVSTYVADIQRIHPLGGPPVGSQPTSPPPMSASGRRGFNTERPATQSTRQNTAPKSEPTEDKSPSPTEDNEDDGQSSTDIQSPEDYNQIFKPKHRIDRSPTRRDDPFPAPPDDAQGAAPSPPVKTPAAAIGATITKPAPTPQVSAPTVKTQTVKPQAVKTPAAKTPAAPATAKPPTAPTPAAAAPTPKPQTPAIVPGHRNEPAGLDVKEFLPKQASPSISSQQTPPDMSESEVIASVNKGHHPIVTVMSGRHKNLQIIRAMWTGGNIKTAVDSAIGMNDLAVIVDILNVLNLKVNLWTLDLCTSFLPQMETLLKSKYENYIITGCASLKIILKSFATVIKTNVLSPPSMGVDISREERYRKCKQCYDYLVNVRSSIESKQSHGKLGSTYRELQILMGQLD